MSAAFVAHLQDLFAPLGAVTARRMFGGHGLYLDGLFFAIVIDDAVYLKADAETVPRFEAAACAPFVYLSQDKPIAMSYWSVPEEAMDSPQAMLPWARLAVAAALRKPKAAKSKAAKTGVRAKPPRS